MLRKVTKLIGLKKNDFDEHVKEGNIEVRKSSLIPPYNIGHEMALTSIFLSSIKLIKEFRNKIFSEIKLNKSGKAFYYTEVKFKDISDDRFDGLILVVIKGIIKDAVVFEMKNKKKLLDINQIKRYSDTCKKILKIEKFVTISNQFVSDPSISPVNILSSKKFKLFHFSWTYIITIGRLLLYDNDDDIEDIDQIHIMKEVLNYFDNKQSGVVGYGEMTSSWKDLCKDINSGKKILMRDERLKEVAISWQQEERDMALMLSRELGVLVKSKTAGSKNNIQKNIKSIVSKNVLNSTLLIKDSISDLKVSANLFNRTLTLTMKLNPPPQKGSVSKLTWLIDKIENCSNKHPYHYNALISNIWIEANIKFTNRDEKINFNRADELYELIKHKDIVNFNLLLIKNLGSDFDKRKVFVNRLESSILNFYEVYFQNLKSYVPQPPKLKESK